MMKMKFEMTIVTGTIQIKGKGEQVGRGELARVLFN
jgi:hypothetical protein